MTDNYSETFPDRPCHHPLQDFSRGVEEGAQEAKRGEIE
jgi:hypothetical protein